MVEVVVICMEINRYKLVVSLMFSFMINIKRKLALNINLVTVISLKMTPKIKTTGFAMMLEKRTLYVKQL